MKHLSILLIFVTLSLSLVYCKAQAQRGKDVQYTSQSRRAKKAMTRAMAFFSEHNSSDAIYEAKQAIEYDSNFVEAYLLLGQIYEGNRKIRQSIYYYRKASEVNPDFYPNVFYILGSHELEYGQYQKALDDFRTYLVNPKMDKRLRKQLDENIDRAYFGIDNVNNPVDFVPKNLGSAINTNAEEYINTISTDGQTIIFTRKGKKTKHTINQRNAQEEDFYRSIKDKDGNWMRALRLGPLFNTNGNEGAMNISPDQSKMVFTACYRKDGFGRCDIYQTWKKGNHWQTPMNIGPPVNTGNWESNACLSSDGKTLYFVRRMGRGNSDIYTAELQQDGSWGNVKSIGDIINSKGSEMTPFIHPDGKTLYFSSDGHLGMGGKDLFYSRKDANGNWSEPVNLGYPINDYKNQMGLIVNAKGDLAYISSDMKGGKGGYDIYSFPLYESARPTAVTYLKGVIRDAKTKKPLQANFELYDLESRKLIVQSQSDAITGDFMVVIPRGSMLALNVNRKSYLFYSDQFMVDGDYSSIKPFSKNIYLNPIEIDRKIVLENVFFATSSYKLEEKSFLELSKVKELLKLNPKLRIEISGHTDNIGGLVANMKLSEQRAKAVYDYLVSIGVSSKQMVYKGYGETMPVADNNSEEGRSKNRRTELKVIGI